MFQESAEISAVKVPILFLAANPVDTARIALDAEARAIAQAIRNTDFRDTLGLITQWAVRPEDLLQWFNEIRPAVVHFSGHGRGSDGLVLQGRNGRSALVANDTLRDLFRALDDDIQVVVFNACYSDAQARAVAEVVDCVIGMGAAVDDRAAREFAAGFYRAIGFDCSVKEAFAQGLAALKLAGLNAADSPRLLVRPGVDAGQIFPLRKAWDPCAGLPRLPKVDLPDTPFHYLNPFERKHAEIFFGRNYDIRALYDQVTERHGHPLQLVFGQSGAGKSSLLHAGLVPRLQSHYEVRYMRRDPHLGLRGTLRQAVGGDWRGLEARYQRPVVVIIDQVEEVFTLTCRCHRRTATTLAVDKWRDTSCWHTTPGEGEAEAELAEFMRELRALFKQPHQRPRGRLILALRDERLAEIEGWLKTAVSSWGKFLVPRLAHGDIVNVVNGLLYGQRLRAIYPVDIDPELGTMIADDLLDDPGSPVAPMLSIIMTELWHQAELRTPSRPYLSIELYREIKKNGLHIASFLQRQLETLPVRHHAHVESGLVLSLLYEHTAPLGVAKLCCRKELAAAYAHLPAGVLDRLLLALKHSHLLVTAAHSRDTRLAHDTLAPVVRDRFNSSERAGPVARRILESRMAEMEATGQRNFLPKPMIEIVNCGRDGMRNLSSKESRFIEQSKQLLADQEKKAREEREKERQRREEEQRQKDEKDRNQRFLLLLGCSIAIVMLVVKTLLLGFALDSRQEAVDTTKRAVQAEDAARTEAERARDTGRAATAALWAVSDPTKAVALLREISDPSRIPTWHSQAAALLGAPIARAVLQGHADAVTAIAFNADGSRIATASADHTARIWHTDGTGEPTILSGHRDAVLAIRFRPDGPGVVTGSADGTARIWSQDLAKAAVTLAGHTAAVTAVAFSPDGQHLATASADGTVRLWDPHTGAARMPLRGHRGPIYALAYRPDSRQLATVSADGTARLWDLANVAKVAVLRGHSGPVRTVAYHPQGHWLVTGSDDGTARWWRNRGKRLSGVLRGHRDQLTAVAFSGDGQRLVTASADRTVRIWHTTGTGVKPGQRGPVLGRHQGSVLNAAFSPDGAQVVTGARDNRARVWALDGSGEWGELPGHGGDVTAAVFSRNGRYLATASIDGNVRIWPQSAIAGARHEGTRPDLTTAPAEIGSQCDPTSAIHRVVLAESGRWPDVSAAPGGASSTVHDSARDSAPSGATVLRDTVQQRLWQATSHCLSVTERQQLLHEDANAARGHYQRCRKDAASAVVTKP